MIVREFQIGSDDDDLTLEFIMSCDIIDAIPTDATELDKTIPEVLEYYTIAYDNGFKVYGDDQERIYFVHE